MQDADSKAEQYLRDGQKAAVRGRTAEAHQKLRKAAMLAPYDERVWLALLSVVEADADRRVCAENILSINPENAYAIDTLAILNGSNPQNAPAPLPQKRKKPPLWAVLGGMILRVLLSFAVGIAIGIGASLLFGWI
jgi:hypothetical protein